MASESGFSLIEVLVSLALLSFAALSGFILIDAMSRVHTRLDERFAQLEALHVILSDFSQDVSSAETIDVLPDASALQIANGICGGAITYSVEAGYLVRDVAACPEQRFELPGVASARFSVLRASTTLASTELPQTEATSRIAAVRLDISLREGDSGLDIYKVVETAGTERR